MGPPADRRGRRLGCSRASNRGAWRKKLLPAQAREYIAELVSRAELEPLDIRIDESLLSGVFTLFEVTTIPLIGPNLCVAPAADPSDKFLDICFVGGSHEMRRRLSEWLSMGSTCAPAPISTRVANSVSNHRTASASAAR